MRNEKRKHVDEMTKAELRYELDDLRSEYDRMMLRNEIVNKIDKLVAFEQLEIVHDFVNKVYKKEICDKFGFWYGMRDNIVDMANNLAEMQNTECLRFINHFMYSMLLDKEPSATDNLYTMTDSMRKALLEHLTNDKVV